MTDLDLDSLAAVAEAATRKQWTEEWFRCHADAYFDASMGAVPALAAYFKALTPPTVLALIAEAREAQRLRGEVAALADEREHDPAVGYDRNEQVELDVEKAHARTLRALIGGGR